MELVFCSRGLLLCELLRQFFLSGAPETADIATIDNNDCRLRIGCLLVDPLLYRTLCPAMEVK